MYITIWYFIPLRNWISYCTMILERHNKTPEKRKLRGHWCQDKWPFQSLVDSLNTLMKWDIMVDIKAILPAIKYQEYRTVKQTYVIITVDCELASAAVPVTAVPAAVGYTAPAGTAVTLTAFLEIRSIGNTGTSITTHISQYVWYTDRLTCQV